MSKTVHESAKFHVTGQAKYIDDILVNDQLLIGKIVYSPVAHAKIKSYNIENAKQLKGVHAVLSYKDISGKNQMGPIVHDELVLAENEVEFIGQAIFLIAAETEEIACKADKLIEIEFEELPAIITIEDAINNGVLLQPERKIECGNCNEAFNTSENIIEGTLDVGGQEHWYLETQVCLSIPGEENEITAYSSTQNPSETQLLISEVLGSQKMDIEVIMRRMGGAFGGKETQGNHVAVWASLLAQKTNRPVKIRLSRDVDQKITGKRHPYLIQYKAAYTNDGIINAVDVTLNANCGATTDLSMAVLERAMLHAENSYFIPNMHIIGKAWKTNIPSNTAYRGFGGPQGMAFIETIIDKIARKLKIDAAQIRYKNFYTEKNNYTPYGQKITHNRLQIIWDKIIKDSEYFETRKKVNQFNQENEFVKKGLAITPVKFGISFTTSFLNQAGALVNIYSDGSVIVNHGGTEMGQGLHTKIQQISAAEFGINYNNIKVTATDTSKVPNTSPTAASSGTDMNGMAVKNACDKLKNRISEALCEINNIKPIEVFTFENNKVFNIKHNLSYDFTKAVSITYINQKSLSATGYYKTPGVHFDRPTGKGNPFYYFAYGMSVSEILLDTLTGHVRILKTDILHDVGDTLNKNIDIGQIEGGFVQGLGWVTSEELKYAPNGNLLNHSPDTYKIPGISDIPESFNVKLLKNMPQPGTIKNSKAVGEPPFMLAFSVWLAIKDAISSVRNHEIEPEFCLPATNENIILFINKLKKQKH